MKQETMKGAALIGAETYTKHTATPWRVGKSGAVVSDEPVPGMRGSDDVNYYGGHLVAESVTQENAAFIVRACNAHEALAEYFLAAKSLQMTLGHPDATVEDEHKAEARYEIAANEARAALAKAGAA